MKALNINDYTYNLPQHRIAVHPLPDRDKSKLLVYRKGSIIHETFTSLPNFLPENAFLFFNDTRVIPARLHFKKDTGADIEIFLLNPVQPSSLIAECMQATETCTWHCTIGNVKRWTPGLVLHKNLGDVQLQATLVDREQGLVALHWSPAMSFAEVVSKAGETPLPPYLKRKPETADRERYQTIYSHYAGAVAAPTAGLHFTTPVFAALQQKNVGHDFLTLHVSAGTFQPVKSENANDHVMHNEQVVISKRNLENLLVPGRVIVPVGTTSMRTLESLYWFGTKLTKNANAAFTIQQNDPHQLDMSLPRRDAIQHVLDYMGKNKLETLVGETSIFIRPGYTFRVCDALITNFHQPGSTLILLVAAFVGNDWKKIYHEALAGDYRFLSYGDSSLLIP